MEQKTKKKNQNSFFEQIRNVKLTNEEIEAQEGDNGREKWGNPSQILDYLFLGSFYNVLDEPSLQTLGITHLLNVAPELETSPKKGVEYKKLGIEDMVNYKDLSDPNLKEQFDNFEEAFKFIDCAKDNNGKVLVHCMRGRSRSASVVIAYLMARQKMSLKDAFVHVKQKRPIIGPHSHLKQQLIVFEFQLFKSNSLHKSTDWKSIGDNY